MGVGFPPAFGVDIRLLPCSLFVIVSLLSLFHQLYISSSDQIGNDGLTSFSCSGYHTSSRAPCFHSVVVSGEFFALSWLSHPSCSMANNGSTVAHLRVDFHNTQGLNWPVKQRKILQNCHAQKADIVLFQETHFPKRYCPSFIHAKFPTFFLANAEDKTGGGVSVLFSHNCKFLLSLEYKIPEGRFLLIKGVINDQMYSFISYYAPNQGQAQFFQVTFKTLNPLLEGTVIYGGGSNVAFDQGLTQKKPLRGHLTHPSKQSYVLLS